MGLFLRILRPKFYKLYLRKCSFFISFLKTNFLKLQPGMRSWNRLFGGAGTAKVNVQSYESLLERVSFCS